jgi:glycosyltransferase involved in cell wall biosynthesis
MEWVKMPLVICGDGNFMAKAKALTIALGLSEKITFKGNISPEKLLDYTQLAYAGINLVEPIGLNQLYSLANKFFDYMHAGIPQLTMKFPEYERINDQYEVAILISTFQTKEIAEKLNILIDNRVLYDRLQQNCIKAAAEFNWQQEEKRLQLFYHNI